jgi:hypothetical protein
MNRVPTEPCEPLVQPGSEWGGWVVPDDLIDESWVCFCKTLPALMAEAGDERIDLLKLDIEGSEYDVLPGLDLAALGIRVLCVELQASRPVAEGKQLIESVSSQGYRLVHCRRPATYTFVQHAKKRCG